MQMETEGELERQHLDKMSSNSKSVTRDKDGQPIMLKGSVHQKDRAAINAYTHNTIESTYIKH